jgi:ATP-dependent Lon protease
MTGEIEILEVEKKIRTRVKKQMEKSQKEYYLNEQMQAIQKELGERDEFKNELRELEEKIAPKKMSGKEAAAEAAQGAEEAQADVADVRRSHGGAQLHRLGAVAAVERD